MFSSATPEGSASDAAEVDRHRRSGGEHRQIDRRATDKPIGGEQGSRSTVPENAVNRSTATAAASTTYADAAASDVVPLNSL